MEIKRKKKLSSVFISCMAVLMVQTGILAIAAFVIFGILINTSFILPASYIIDKLEEALQKRNRRLRAWFYRGSIETWDRTILSGRQEPS